MKVQTFFDPATFTLSYVVFDPVSRDAVVIDPVLDYDPLSSSTSTASVERLEEFLVDGKLTVHYVLETHAHADHLSGSQWLKRRHHCKIGIGARITEVQRTFGAVFDLGPSFPVDGSQFDHLFRDGETLLAGTLQVGVIATPGHTPACVSYTVGDAVFTGDALFIEDYGTGRCDFPNGSADALYTSVHDRLYTLPDETRVFVGHDYQPNGRSMRAETTIARSKAENVQLRAATTRREFVEMRAARDAKLAPPRLLYPSVQVNVDAGRLPRPHANGRRYLRIPIDLGTTTDEDGTPLGRRTKAYLLYDRAKANRAGYRDVAPSELAPSLGDVRIVDVRNPDELSGDVGRLEGSENVPLATLEHAAQAWDRNQELVLVCRSGARSGRAAAYLTAIGFTRVMSLVGGMAAWNDAGLPRQR